MSVLTPTPFTIQVPKSDLEDLDARLRRVRWPDELPHTGWELGVPLHYMKELVEYWRDDYDWRSQEAFLNSFPQFMVEIDGARVHFLHVGSPEPDALPLILTHGWPGSIVEFLGVIGPLTDPRAHGADSSNAFHVVVPSIPGFGFSGPTCATGWHVNRIARAWADLMSMLGYKRYGVQGGDWGSAISREVARVDPEHVVGAHVNLLLVPFTGGTADLEALSDQDRSRLRQVEEHMRDRASHYQIQSTRPQTLSYALTDSPAGQLAWVMETFHGRTESAGAPDLAIARDSLLTNVMLYWLTATAGSSARLYYETTKFRKSSPSVRGTVPTGVAVFPRDVPSVRATAELEENIIYWQEYERGGHFAALEVPNIFAETVREFFALVK